MIIKFNRIKISIFVLLVIFFPLVQNQWLNLYLFDINNFTIYKFLYYLSGLLFPLIICITSLNNFTHYDFGNNKVNNNTKISGKLLLIITVISLIILSFLLYNYISINLKVIYNLFLNENKNLVHIDIDKQILLSAIICISLLFNKLKLIIKKLILMNYLVISLIIWFSKINNILFYDSSIFNNTFKIDNINFFNIIFLLSIEITYYLWSYISHGTYLSDWRMPIPRTADISPIIKIIFFYLMIILYYSQLLK